MRQVVERLVGSATITVRLRPLSSAEMAGDGLAYKSWGQVFTPTLEQVLIYPDLYRTRPPDGLPVGVPGADCMCGRRPTGHGAVCLVLNRLETKPLGAPRRGPAAGGELGPLLGQLDLTQRKRESLQKLLTDKCQSVSLWVHIRKESQSWHYCTVRLTDSEVTRTYAAAW